jgi:hypothetical protein
MAIAGAARVQPVRATELKPETVKAFDEYVQITEAQMDDDLRDGRFLLTDRLPEDKRMQAYADLRAGKFYIQPLHTLKDGQPIPVPNGIIHDWAGIEFIPGGTLARTMALLHDYDHQAEIYQPDVRKSHLVEQHGNELKVSMQLANKAIITVVLNANFDVFFSVLSDTRATGTSYSTRLAEVEKPDKPNEYELPVGNDHGYLWRIYSYWRVEQADGGVYLEVESVGLTRNIPALFAWVEPFLQSIPRAYLNRFLSSSRRAVQDPAIKLDTVEDPQ